VFPSSRCEHKSPGEPPPLFSFRLEVNLPPQVLQTNRRFYHPVPASLSCRKIVNNRVPSLPGHYPASLLLRTHPSSSRLRLTSQWFLVIEPTFLHRFPDGTRRTSPVAQRILLTMLSLPPRWSGQPLQSVSATHAAFTLTVAGSASRASHFRGHLCVRFRYGLVTRHHPLDGVVDRLQGLGFPKPCYPSYRVSDFCPGRTVSC